MNDKDQKLLQEAYNEVLLNEINFRKAATTAGLAAASLFPSTGKAQAQQVPQQAPITQQATTQQTDINTIINHMKDFDTDPFLKKLYDTIMNSTQGFSITKERLINAIYKPEDAAVFLKAMPEEVKKSKINVFGVNAGKGNVEYVKYHLTGLDKNSIAYTTPNGNVYFMDSAKTSTPESTIATLAHECEHKTSQENIYSKEKHPFMTPPGQFPENKAGSMISPKSILYRTDNTFNGREPGTSYTSEVEVRGYVAGSRAYWGAVNSEQDFENKWNYLEQTYNKDPKNFWSYAKFPDGKTLLPDQLRVQFTIYKTQMANKEQQEKFKNQIKNAVMDNSVAANANKNIKNVA